MCFKGWSGPRKSGIVDPVSFMTIYFRKATFGHPISVTKWAFRHSNADVQLIKII